MILGRHQLAQLLNLRLQQLLLGSGAGAAALLLLQLVPQQQQLLLPALRVSGATQLQAQQLLLRGRQRGGRLLRQCALLMPASGGSLGSCSLCQRGITGR